MSVNRVVLTGRLTADPEMRQTTTGKNVATFTIAVQKRTKPKEGEPTADFLRITPVGEVRPRLPAEGKACGVRRENPDSPMARPEWGESGIARDRCGQRSGIGTSKAEFHERSRR